MKQPSEHEEQCAVMQWVALHEAKHPCLKWMFAVPNGGKRHVSVGVKLKREGVKAGVPDLILPVPLGVYNGLIIEMKVRKGGTVKKHQKIWLEALDNLGWKVHVCHGADEAIEAIKNYLCKQ